MDSKAQGQKQEQVGVDDLKRDIQQLREDLSQLSGAVLDKQRSHVSQLRDDVKRESREALGRARQRGDEAVKRARDVSNRTVSEIEEKIDERPFMSMLLIFCVGLLLGRIMDRS